MNIYNNLTDEQLMFLGQMVWQRVRWYENNAPKARMSDTARGILKELEEEYENRFPGQDWRSDLEIPKAPK